MTTPLQTYLAELHRLRSIGVATDETSYYPPLHNLLNELGRRLKPKVFCLSQPKDAGGGRPDLYLFTANQLAKTKSLKEPIPDAPPERGVIEVKGTGEEVGKLAKSKQVADYWKQYGLVLATNYRDFLLVGTDDNRERVVLESFRLAASEDSFWKLAAQPAAAAKALNTQFVEFLTRVLLHQAPLAQPKDVAWFLASYARDALARVEASGEMPALDAVRGALEQALGLRFEGDKGEHFFRSTLVQTLFYGVFSAWVLWSRQHEAGSTARFEWKTAAWSLHVPMVRTLFTAVATPERLGPLGLVEVLDWTAAALNRVDRPAFFARFEQAQAVQYFYEPFLEAFDPDLRKQLGVWYTPPEIVKYMVARVDSVLRSELGLADGLADPNVYILDPCCGTGSYLVEVLHRIERTLRDKAGDALIAQDLKQAAMHRVFGFEIMPAPYVIAHWQIGLMLQNLDAPLSDADDERAGIYLTNSLTGWEPPSGPKDQFPMVYPEFGEERAAASRVKRTKPILVVLGNPPYNGFSGLAVAEERHLTDAYRKTKRAPAPDGRGLNDLYVRFFRVAERRITEQTGKGIVCFISNYSWLDGRSYTGMREHYLESFDNLWIDNLNGDKYKTGKLTPKGEPDPSVFSTEYNREGIQIGISIATMVRRASHRPAKAAHYREFWGTRKLKELTASIEHAANYEELSPPLSLGLPLIPTTLAAAYFNWPTLPEILPTYEPGVFTARDSFVVDIDRDRLAQRLISYFDPGVSDERMREIAPSAMLGTSRFNPVDARRYLQKRGILEQNVVRFSYRPFDVRWLYWEPETKLLDRNRGDYFPLVYASNYWLAAAPKLRRESCRPPVTRALASLHLMERGTSCFPLFVRLFAADREPEQRLNLSRKSLAYVSSIGADNSALFYHAIAILHAPAYEADNHDALRQDWPRIPLPRQRKSLENSADQGSQIAQLLDTETSVGSVGTDSVRSEMRLIAPVTRSGGGALKPRDLEVTAGWGHAGQGGVTMPGKGRIVGRAYTAEERAAIAAGAATLGLTEAQAFGCLGNETCDVYLNDTAYWSNVPAKVWGYTIGGYQVMKKWLSYREHDLLGRALTPEEARYVTEMARRIAAILLLQPALDANYRAVVADTYPWPQD